MLKFLLILQEDDLEIYKTVAVTHKESESQLTDNENEAVDPWALPEFERSGPKWQGRLKLRIWAQLLIAIHTLIQFINGAISFL